MAKVLKGSELTNVKAATSQLIKNNYDAGARTLASREDLKDYNISLDAPKNTWSTTNYMSNYVTAQQARAPQPSWLQKVFGQTADIVGAGAGIVKDAAITTGKDVAGLFVNAAMAIPAFATSYKANEREADIKKIEATTLDLYNQGKIDINDYISRMEYANELRKNNTKALEEFSKYQKPFVKTNENGDIDWTEQGISIFSGGLTLASLGLGSAVGTAVAGTTRAISTSAIAPRTMAIGKLAIGSQAERLAAKTVTEKLAISADKLLTKVPGWSKVAERGLSRVGTSQTARSALKNAAVEAAIRAPIRRENLRFTVDVLDDYKEGNYFSSEKSFGAIPSTVLVAGTLAAGGVFGFMSRYFPKLGVATRNAMYGEKSFLDDLSVALNNRGVGGTIPAGVKEVMDTGTKETVEKLQQHLKQLTDYNLSGRSSQKASEAMADAIITKLATGGRAVDNLTMKEIVEDMVSWVDAQDLLIPVNKQLGKAGYATVAKYSIETQNSLMSSISKAVNSAKKEIEAKFPKPKAGKAGAKVVDENAAQRLAMRKEIAKGVLIEEAKNNAYWAQNADVFNAIMDSIDKATTIKGVVAAPRVVDARKLAKLSKGAISKDIAKKIADKGYTVIMVETPRAKLKSAEETADVVLRSKFIPVSDEVFQKAASSKPVFRSMGAALNKAGLGLDDTSQMAYKEVRNAATDYLDAQFGEGKGSGILNALQQYIEHGSVTTRTATDVRMLTTAEIQAAMKPISTISKAQAKQISKMVIQAHLDASLNLQGLANKLVAGSYKYNPLYKYYARAQGALRYSWNPFFRTQEIVETEVLGQALAGGKNPWVYGMGKIRQKTAAQLDEVVDRMEQAGFFHDGMMATRYGEAAQDVFIGRMSANITKTQKRSLAGVVSRMSEKYQMPVEQLIKEHPQDVIDMIRPIIQYPTKGVLNSNMAKALNIAVFPARYNLKVTQLAVKALSQQSAGVQLATIDKLWEMESWLQTAEGIAWQRENAEAIGVFNWLTPLGSIQWVFDTLNTIQGKGKGNMFEIGMIGGLPFGVISQILENQGIITISTPYVSPEKGELYAKRIPESMAARGASALMDLLGSTFTYPGRVLGLPGKAQALRDVASIPFPTDSGDWEKKIYSTEDLPEMQQHRQEIWANEYLKEMGYNVGDVPPSVAIQRMMLADVVVPKQDFGKSYTKSELNALKQASKEAKATSGAAKDGNGILTPRTGAKKATFPSNLPQ